MKHNEKKMVDAILTDNPSEFVDAFKDDMNNRVSNKLDDERTQVSRDIIHDKSKED
jgi:hypothetical protein